MCVVLFWFPVLDLALSLILVLSCPPLSLSSLSSSSSRPSAKSCCQTHRQSSCDPPFPRSPLASSFVRPRPCRGLGVATGMRPPSQAWLGHFKIVHPNCILRPVQPPAQPSTALAHYEYSVASAVAPCPLEACPDASSPFHYSGLASAKLRVVGWDGGSSPLRRPRVSPFYLTHIRTQREHPSVAPLSLRCP